MGLFKGARLVPLSIRSWNCSFGQTYCSALWMMAFHFVALLDFFFFFVLCNKIPPPLEERVTGSEKGVEFAAVGRRIVILMAEGRVRKARGGKCKLLNGKSKARDGNLSCLVCNSERVCPLACVTWAGCPSSEGGSVTEHGNLSIILVSLIPQREPALTTNLYTCLFFFFPSPSCPL